MNSPEKWRDIPGYEGYYQVSDHGRVKALARVVHKRITKPGQGSSPVQLWKERMMKISPKSQYNKVTLSRDGKGGTYNVNVLVLLAFVGNPPPRCQALHNDGNPHNNYLSNLRWGTCRDNQLDRKLHGTALDGEKHPNAKLTDAQVQSILSDHRGPAAIARDYQVTTQCVSQILLRKSRRTT